MKNTILSLMVLFLVCGCASQSANRSVDAETEKTERLKSSPNTWNPPPKEIFSGFGQFELKHAELAAPLNSDPKKVTSAKEAGSLIAYTLDPLFSEWRQQDNNRTLIIEPTFTEYRIISGGARFWGGPLPGIQKSNSMW